MCSYINSNQTYLFVHLLNVVVLIYHYCTHTYNTIYYLNALAQYTGRLVFQVILPGNDLEFGKKILKTWNFVEVDFICTKVLKYIIK